MNPVSTRPHVWPLQDGDIKKSFLLTYPFFVFAFAAFHTMVFVPHCRQPISRPTLRLWPPRPGLERPLSSAIVALDVTSSQRPVFKCSKGMIICQEFILRKHFSEVDMTSPFFVIFWSEVTPPSKLTLKLTPQQRQKRQQQSQFTQNNLFSNYIFCFLAPPFFLSFSFSFQIVLSLTSRG